MPHFDTLCTLVEFLAPNAQRSHQICCVCQGTESSVKAKCHAAKQVQTFDLVQNVINHPSKSLVIEGTEWDHNALGKLQ